MAQETKTTICNKALLLIGEEPINSYDDDTSLAGRVCRLHFDSVFRSVLESGHWTDVTTVEMLLPISLEQRKVLGLGEDWKNPTESDYGPLKRYYSLPANCATIIDVYPAGREMFRQNPVSWNLRYLPALGNKFIETSYDMPMSIEYIKEIKNMDLFSSKFGDCLYTSLAATICMAITKDLQKTQALIQYASQVKADALRENLNEDGEDKQIYVPASIMARGR